MTLLRQWQLLNALMPTLMVLRPVERMVAWNLGHIDDALTITLAHLHCRTTSSAPLVVFHTGLAPALRPVQWARSQLRGVPTEPWLEPVAGRPSRWTPHRQVLESVLLSSPPGPVDLLIAGDTAWGSQNGSSPLGAVRQGGHLLLSEPSPRGTLQPRDWAPADPSGSGRLYRKLTPQTVPERAFSRGRLAGPSLACHHDQAVLVDSYTNLARSLAHRFSHRGERAEDLEQVAMVALIKAAGRYDPGRGRTFGGYAAACITGELKRHFRDKMWMLRVPRSTQEMYLAIRTARDELSQTNGTSPTIAQIAAHLDTTEEDVLAAMEAADNSWPVSLDVPSPDGSSSVTEIPVNESGFDDSLVHGMLKDSIRHLSPTERLVLKRVFFDGRTQRQVAEELHVSQMQVSRIMRRTIAIMRQQFQPA